MHRYQPDTVSTVLAALGQFIARLEKERTRLHKRANETGTLPDQRRRAQKSEGMLTLQIEELTAWANDVLHPLAQRKITLDLDEGVRRNYQLFAGALKPVRGMQD